MFQLAMRIATSSSGTWLLTASDSCDTHWIHYEFLHGVLHKELAWIRTVCCPEKKQPEYHITSYVFVYGIEKKIPIPVYVIFISFVFISFLFFFSLGTFHIVQDV